MDSALPSETTIRSNFGERALVYLSEEKWSPSPAQGVDRKRLDRIGGEVARATSVVRYAPGSEFPTHVHGGGEEILVLEGIFSDETGHYGPGTYLRNPIGSSHAPFSKDGCTIFVKLHQHAEDDRVQFAIPTHEREFVPGLVDGLSVLPLHQHGTESVALVRWAPGTVFRKHRHYGGEEILVLEGTFEDEHGQYPEGTWLRNPSDSIHTPFSTEGCLIWVKTGHLL